MKKIKGAGFVFAASALLGLALSAGVLASEVGIAPEEFMRRYTAAIEEYNGNSQENGTVIKKTFDYSDIISGRFSPNGIMEMILNGNSALKEPIGSLILVTNDIRPFTTQDITEDIAFAIYAFDPYFRGVDEATDFYVSLSHNKTGTSTHGDVDYTILNQGGDMLQVEGVYRRYTPVLNVTATPTPIPEGWEPEEESENSTEQALETETTAGSEGASVFTTTTPTPVPTPANPGQVISFTIG